MGVSGPCAPLCPLIQGASGMVSRLRLLVSLWRRQTLLPLLHVVIGRLSQVARREIVENGREEIPKHGTGRCSHWRVRAAGGGRNALLSRTGRLFLLPIARTKG